MTPRTPLRRAAAGAVLALALTACGGATTDSGGSDAGEVRIALNSWVGYEANAAVAEYVIESETDAEVTLTQIDEEPAWEPMSQGSLDAVLENWGHEDLKKTYIEERKTLVEGGPTGGEGVIGWYVPKYVVDAHPDITDWKNLNKYEQLFVTPESGGKGQFLGGSPSYVTNDVALIENLDLDYKVVFAGSEAAQITQVRKLYQERKPVLFYFYEPQWLFSELDLVKIDLPPYTPGCDADPKKVACDYPKYTLDKIFSKRFAEANSEAYQVLKNMRMTNEQQNEVAVLIADKGMKREDAAKEWAEKNKEVWQAWLPEG